MPRKHKEKNFLLGYIESKQKKRIFYITREETLAELNTDQISFNNASRRLCKKNKLYKIHPNFYIIVPLEFQDEKCPPPDFFFDSFMGFLEHKYYVSFFSAVALHEGKSLTQPEFQVMISKLRPLTKTPPYTIRYFTKKYWPLAGVDCVKAPFSFLNVSSPELTSFDLMKYYFASGESEIVKQTLKTFAKRLRADELAELADKMKSSRAEIIHWQRLGHLLDQLGEEELTAPLAQWIEKTNPKSGYLNPPKPDKPILKETRDVKWKLLINKVV